MTSLLSAVSRYADAHADENGIAPTPVPGLLTVRATAPSGLQHDILRPLICLVVQGSKHVTTGKQGFHFSAGESLLITADVPTVSQITRASIAAPYYSLVLELDPAVIARSEEHTSELQSLMRISYAVFCLKKKKEHNK